MKEVGEDWRKKNCTFNENLIGQCGKWSCPSGGSNLSMHSSSSLIDSRWNWLHDKYEKEYGKNTQMVHLHTLSWCLLTTGIFYPVLYIIVPLISQLWWLLMVYLLRAHSSYAFYGCCDKCTYLTRDGKVENQDNHP